MNFLFYILLFVFWTLLGSFASVVIYRIKSWEKWIFMGRSHCSKCDRQLSNTDLIPLVWYALAKWKCKKCKKKVPLIYPILEVSMWLLFIAIWYFLIDINLILSWSIGEIFILIFWLFIGFITIVYTFYDILFLEIPESILAIWIVWAAAILFLEVFSAWALDYRFIVFDWMTYINGWSYLLWQIILLIWVIVSLYIIMLKELSEILDIIILIILWGAVLGSQYYFSSLYPEYTFQSPVISGLLWALGIFTFFFAQIVVSKWAWMWWGDLRIGILIWLMLGTMLSFPGMMLTYMIGSIVWVWFILYSRLGKWETTMTTQIPFGPFLAAGFFVCIFFGETILKFMSFYL